MAARPATPPGWLSALPELGVGLGFRRRLARPILESREAIDFLEIVSEHFLWPSLEQRRQLAALRRRFPLVPHGLGLSLGSVEPPEAEYLAQLERLVRAVDPPWWSEHVAMTRAGGLDVGHLAPIPFTRAMVDVVCENVARARRGIGLPLALENIAYTHAFAGNEMSEAEFLGAVATQADCALLLDLMNLHANSQNHGYDPIAFLDALPLERVVQVHVIGGRWEAGRLVDSHSTPTPAAVWELLSLVAERVRIKAVLVEWDEAFPPFDVVLRELSAARQRLRAGVCGAPAERVA